MKAPCGSTGSRVPWLGAVAAAFAATLILLRPVRKALDPLPCGVGFLNDRDY